MTVLLQSQIRCCDKPGHMLKRPGRRARRLVPQRTFSSTSQSLATPRVGLATRLFDFATNRRGKRGRRRETMKPLTCHGLLARVQREGVRNHTGSESIWSYHLVMDEFATFFAEYQDYLAPRLDVYEQAVYLYVSRHTIAVGKREATIGFKSARKKDGFRSWKGRDCTL